MGYGASGCPGGHLVSLAVYRPPSSGVNDAVVARFRVRLRVPARVVVETEDSGRGARTRGSGSREIPPIKGAWGLDLPRTGSDVKTGYTVHQSSSEPSRGQRGTRRERAEKEVEGGVTRSARVGGLVLRGCGSSSLPAGAGDDGGDAGEGRGGLRSGSTC
ncbi:hypothetical protein LZ30DRAFT_707441 [Colletotrichum cereale]|nr:hypothetical protein LZ30DRAFT_707441 [Colletotrichum cereale]